MAQSVRDRVLEIVQMSRYTVVLPTIGLEFESCRLDCYTRFQDFDVITVSLGAGLYHLVSYSDKLLLSNETPCTLRW